MLGFLFPGQGAQSVGMLSDLAAREPIVRATLEEADDALGLSLRAIIADGPETELNRTSITQPALLATSIAIWRLWNERGGPRPAMLAGHSLGEYSALVAAEALTFADAVRLVHRRGQLMQAAVPEGEGLMAAVLGLDDADLEAVCAAIDDVAPANYNAPGQIVLAGRRAAVEQAIETARQAGARRAVPLAMSVPSHSPLMAAAAEQLAAALAETDVATPVLPVYRNVDAAISTDADGVRQALAAQLHSPVRWSNCVTAMLAAGADVFVECGPGNVLAGLVKRIQRGVPVHATGNADSFDAALAAVAG